MCFWCRAVCVVASGRGVGTPYKQGDAWPAQPTAGAVLWDRTYFF